METVRLLLALAAQKNWLVYQLNAKSSFLNGELNEEVFVEQPKGYKVYGSEHLVYRLYKALFCLKQEPRA